MAPLLASASTAEIAADQRYPRPTIVPTRDGVMVSFRIG
jgi:hypothetical protein